MKQIAYTKAALRTLQKMPATTAARVRKKISEYAADPLSQTNNVKKLHGHSGVRLRVGDWRVIMEDGAVLAIIEIGPRGSIYD